MIYFSALRFVLSYFSFNNIDFSCFIYTDYDLGLEGIIKIYVRKRRNKINKTDKGKYLNGLIPDYAL